MSPGKAKYMAKVAKGYESHKKDKATRDMSKLIQVDLLPAIAASQIDSLVQATNATEVAEVLLAKGVQDLVLVMDNASWIQDARILSCGAESMIEPLQAFARLLIKYSGARIFMLFNDRTKGKEADAISKSCLCLPEFGGLLGWQYAVVRYSLTKEQRYELHETRVMRTRLGSDSYQKLKGIRSMSDSKISTYKHMMNVLLYPEGYQGVRYRYWGTSTTK
jgi:hypothetical protein